MNRFFDYGRNRVIDYGRNRVIDYEKIGLLTMEGRLTATDILDVD